MQVKCFMFALPKHSVALRNHSFYTTGNIDQIHIKFHTICKRNIRDCLVQMNSIYKKKFRTETQVHFIYQID